MIHKLDAGGVPVRVSAAPWIPGVSDAQALIERIDERIPIQFDALNVNSPEVAASPYGMRFSQHEVNEAFTLAFRQVEARPNVKWLRPVLADASDRRDPFRDLLDDRERSASPAPTA